MPRPGALVDITPKTLLLHRVEISAQKFSLPVDFKPNPAKHRVGVKRSLRLIIQRMDSLDGSWFPSFRVFPLKRL
ncbi:hypothetical protein NHX12_019180 [Muraenolepis orangiensis]|uniref:Uncharacterized protein n=1 Tax=Muraenolepis orangiensis TaxID=630683 RepID=A0A9Q0EUV6_9TELE|nr:hypothetical protein NHX12_019180 [Muraenolepis orangiensis]